MNGSYSLLLPLTRKMHSSSTGAMKGIRTAGGNESSQGGQRNRGSRRQITQPGWMSLIVAGHSRENASFTYVITEVGLYSFKRRAAEDVCQVKEGLRRQVRKQYEPRNVSSGREHASARMKRVHFLLNGTPLHSSSHLRRYIFSSNNSGIKSLALQRSLDVSYANFVPMKYPRGQG